MPAAFIAAGFWACGDDNSTASTECVTEQCHIDKYGSFNADSANAANQQNPVDTGAASQGQDAPFNGDPATNPYGTPADTSGAGVLSQDPTLQSSSGNLSPESSDALRAESSSSHKHHASSSSEATLTESSSSEAAIVNPGDTFKEDFRDECPVTSIPKIGSNPKLPDPFTAFDGSKVTTKAQWKCRREEIAALLEKVELGEKPRNPEKVEGSYSGGSLKVTVTDKEKTSASASRFPVQAPRTPRSPPLSGSAEEAWITRD